MSKPAVVVLGASGFIGRRIVSALAASGFEPIAASRCAPSADFGTTVRKIALNAVDQGALYQALTGASGVVNCIAGNSGDIVAGGRALLAAATQVPKPPRIVYLSSVAAYGSAQGRVDEDTTLLGDLGSYSAAKATVDRLCAASPTVVRLRPGIVYGPGSAQWSTCVGQLLLARRLGDLGAAGSGTCNLVHVDDVATAVVRSLQDPAVGGEAFNLGSPHPISWNEYFGAYGRALGISPVPTISRLRLTFELHMLGPPLKVLDITARLRGRRPERPAIRPWLVRPCAHRIQMDVSKAERILGLGWKPLEEGLQQTAAWFRHAHTGSISPQ